MNHGVLTTLLTTVVVAGCFTSPSHAQTDPARAECDRLIDVLEQRTPAGAHEALQQMRVFREGNQYQACIDAGQVDQTSATSADWNQLPPDKQQRIRDYVERQETAPMAPGENIAVGATVPRSVPLRGLPRDMVTEIPKITSYRYVVLRDGIAIVEPSSRTVVQIIGR